MVDGANRAVVLVSRLGTSVYVTMLLQALDQFLHELHVLFSMQKLVEQRHPCVILYQMQYESPVAYPHLTQAA